MIGDRATARALCAASRAAVCWRSPSTWCAPSCAGSARHRRRPALAVWGATAIQVLHPRRARSVGGAPGSLGRGLRPPRGRRRVRRRALPACAAPIRARRSSRRGSASPSSGSHRGAVRSRRSVPSSSCPRSSRRPRRGPGCRAGRRSCSTLAVLAPLGLAGADLVPLPARGRAGAGLPRRVRARASWPVSSPRWPCPLLARAAGTPDAGRRGPGRAGLDLARVHAGLHAELAGLVQRRARAERGRRALVRADVRHVVAAAGATLDDEAVEPAAVGALPAHGLPGRRAAPRRAAADRRGRRARERAASTGACACGSPRRAARRRSCSGSRSIASRCTRSARARCRSRATCRRESPLVFVGIDRPASRSSSTIRRGPAFAFELADVRSGLPRARRRTCASCGPDDRVPRSSGDVSVVGDDVRLRSRLRGRHRAARAERARTRRAIFAAFPRAREASVRSS